MDKEYERKADSKKRDGSDKDIGVWDYDAGGKCEQLDGLWAVASKEVVGLGPERQMTNVYCKSGEKEKGEGSSKEEASDLVDEVLNGGPPIFNTSRVRRVF